MLGVISSMEKLSSDFKQGWNWISNCMKLELNRNFPERKSLIR